MEIIKKATIRISAMLDYSNFYIAFKDYYGKTSKDYIANSCRKENAEE